MSVRTALLPTLVLGPREAGAAWDVLQASANLALEDAQQLRLRELLVAIDHWAQLGEAPMMALLPLGNGADLLVKAAWGSAISPTALPMAHAMLLPPGMARASLLGTRLLPLLPAPDGSRQFGRQPIPVPPVLPDAPLRPGWPDIGLAWRNRVVIVPEAADVVPALATVLATSGPPEQAGRITGWATTAMLPAVGDFDPWEACQLLVLGPGRPQPYGHPYLPARFNILGEPEPAVPPPAAWRAWTAFRDAAGAQAMLPWDMDMTVEPVPALLARLADHADDDRARRPALLTALLNGEGPQGFDLRATGLALLAGWLAQDGAAALPEAEFRALGSGRLIAALDSLDRPGEALAHLSDAHLLWLAEALVNHPLAAGHLGCAMVLRLIDVPGGAALVPQLVAQRLEGAGGLDLERLASRRVIEALGPGHAALALKVTRLGLRQPAATLAGLGTSLAALQLAGVTAR